MVLALYVGFSRLHHLRFLERDPVLVGILEILELPPQCTFWRFLASLHLTVAQQLVEVQRQMRQRVWEAANVKLKSVTFDTDTTVHTVYGKQVGARRSYNPKNKGKKSFQPLLTFIAETREFGGGELDQGSQQRCGVGRASLEALGHELRTLPTGHAGLQPELLVGALQPRKDSRRRRDETRTTVDDATALSVSGGQDLAP
jgi:hypothetical protein